MAKIQFKGQQPVSSSTTGLTFSTSGSNTKNYYVGPSNAIVTGAPNVSDLKTSSSAGRRSGGSGGVPTKVNVQTVTGAPDTLGLTFTQAELQEAEKKIQTTSPQVSQPVRKVETQTVRQPQNILENIASRTILSGTFGIQPAQTPYEIIQAAKRAGATNAEISQMQAERVTSGLVLGSTGGVAGVAGRGIVSRAAGRVDEFAGFFSEKVPRAKPVVEAGRSIVQTGGEVVSRAPKGTKDILYYGGTGVGYIASGQATAIGKEREANRIVKDLTAKGVPITKAEATELVETYNAVTIQKGLTGSIKQTVDQSGAVVSREVIRPEVGGEDLLGTGQRFALGGVPGLTSFFAPKSSRAAAEEALRARNIPVTEANVQSLIQAGQTTGIFSTIGIFGSEVSSELGVGRAVRGGSAALRAAKDVKEQRTALRSLIVPPTVVAGIFEGGSQTYNVESLTRKEPEVGRVFMGGAIGGLSAGSFSLLTAQFTPTGKGRAVTGLGYALDFPGEPVGDIIAGRVRRGEGLRIPILTAGVPSITPTITDRAAPKGGTKTATSFFSEVFTPSRTINIGGRSVPVDEFGLPVPDVVKTPSRTGTPSITPTRTTIPELAGILEPAAQAETNVSVSTATNVNVPSFVNVPTLVPTGLPFFPPGRLAGEGKGEGKRERLGYFDELAAAFTGLNPRTGEPLKSRANLKEYRAQTKAIKARARAIQVLGKASGKNTRGFFGQASGFSGFNALLSPRGRPSRRSSVRGRPAGLFRFGVFR